MSTGFYPTITPVKLADAPTKEALMESMIPLIEESESWTLGNKYETKERNLVTQTFSRARQPRDGAMWHGRVSEHAKEAIGGWDRFWDGLGKNHSLNEKEYFHELTDVRLLKKLSDDQEIWTLHYSLKPPISNRMFTVLITTHTVTSPEGLNTGYVLSVPIDVSSDAELASQEFKATRGAYAAVERIQELPDGGVNWRMITSSTSGGLVPQYFVEKSLPGKIKDDVPLFLDWLEKKHGTQASTSQA